MSVQHATTSWDGNQPFRRRRLRTDPENRNAAFSFSVPLPYSLFGVCCLLGRIGCDLGSAWRPSSPRSRMRCGSKWRRCFLRSRRDRGVDGRRFQAAQSCRGSSIACALALSGRHCLRSSARVRRATRDSKHGARRASFDGCSRSSSSSTTRSAASSGSGPRWIAPWSRRPKAATQQGPTRRTEASPASNVTS